MQSMPSVGNSPESQAFFAALLAAQRSKCNCQVCKILRGVADSLVEQFAPAEVVNIAKGQAPRG